MKHFTSLCAGMALASVLFWCSAVSAADSQPASVSPRPAATGPLRASKANPRYFTNSSGQAIVLVGSHTWDNLQDMGQSDPPTAFDFDAYLDFLSKHNHNFIRLWRWELVSWNTQANREKSPRRLVCAPHPWARTGPGAALDGKPKFNLEQYDELYFKRLRQRVTAARDRGIYLSIMLFEGWGPQFVPDAWKSHPFNRANNVNNIEGDTNGDGKGLEVHALADPKITALQEAYIRKVIDTVNDLDNVLYEISNENHPPSTQWQYHMIRFIHDYEKAKPKQHPVGMTFQYRGGKNAALFDSPADWVSPNPDADAGYNYRDNPPPAAGKKVVLSDTDHLWGIGGDVAWVWKSFLRGHNPIFMDPYKRDVLDGGPVARWEPVRQAMGAVRRLADRMDLTAMTPTKDLASSGYCLANPGREYVVYLPKAGEVTLDLSAATGEFAVEWLNPQTGEATKAQNVAGGAKRSWQLPLAGDAVLHLKARTAE